MRARRSHSPRVSALSRTVGLLCVVVGIVVLCLDGFLIVHAVDADVSGNERSQALASLGVLFGLPTGEVVDDAVLWIARAVGVVGVGAIVAGAIVMSRRRKRSSRP